MWLNVRGQDARIFAFAKWKKDKLIRKLF